jgi:hypothetical protein
MSVCQREYTGSRWTLRPVTLDLTASSQQCCKHSRPQYRRHPHNRLPEDYHSTEVDLCVQHCKDLMATVDDWRACVHQEKHQRLRHQLYRRVAECRACVLLSTQTTALLPTYLCEDITRVATGEQPPAAA